MVAKHLRPGKLIIFQFNFDNPAMTTVDIFNKDITLLVSRDSNGYAEGKTFLDLGETLSELSMKQYEYYNFKLSGKVLKKEVINTSLMAFEGFGLEKVVILNAADLSDTSFACFYDMVGE